MKFRQQTLYRFMLIISALVALVVIGKADIGAVFNHHNLNITPGFRIMK